MEAVEDFSTPFINRKLQVNNWLIPRSCHHVLGVKVKVKVKVKIKVKNTDHGVTTDTNVSTCSKSHPDHPLLPTITQCIGSPD
jgi:hypothetical protein